MTANPIDQIGGLTTSAAVPKADVSAWAKARVPQVIASVSELRSMTLATQAVIVLKATGITYFLDAADTTTADDGVTCIVSSDGFRFKILSQTVNGLTVTASVGTLTIPNNAAAVLQMTGNFTLDLTVTANATPTFPSGSYTLVGAASTQTLTNKTIDTASNTFKLNGTAVATAAQFTAALAAFTGDAGSGGVKGLVPAPAAGDAAAGKYLGADGGYSKPGAAGHIGLYAGLQPLKLGTALIGVNPGSFCDLNGTTDYSTTAVLTANLSTATINTGVSPPVGGMLSPGALSTSGTTNDGTDVMLYLVKRNSDGVLALVGDNANVYTSALAAVISNASNSFSTGGPQTGFWNGTKVRLTSTGTFPSGFAANTDYFVVSETAGATSTTFGLSATYGGSAITAASTYTGQLVVKFGVQDHLDAAFGAGVWSVLRRVHFAFRWRWQWPGSGGGIPDFTADPRSDKVYLGTGGNDTGYQVLASTNGASFADLDLSPWVSNLCRIVGLRAAITSTGTAGTAAVRAKGVTTNGKFLGEGPTAGVTTVYGAADVQTDSAGVIQWQASGGSKLQLFLDSFVFVDPS